MKNFPVYLERQKIGWSWGWSVMGLHRQADEVRLLSNGTPWTLMAEGNEYVILGTLGT
jgi:hypothetical protein